MISVHKTRKRSPQRVQTETAKEPDAQSITLSAPVYGWVENDSIVNSNPQAALVMDNAFPTEMSIRIRGGRYKVASAGAAVVSMFNYKTSTTSKIFAATASNVYDISALDPVTTPSASISGQTAGYYSSAQMGTVGADYLYIVNGADEAQLYDGSTWTQIDGVSTPAITGVTTSDLSYVWKHKNRLWFVEKDTNTAWYLPVDSVGGAAADFSLQGVFQDGGSLSYGATWSQDSGDGMDDRIVFVSDQGEVAVYQGTNPASASTWALVGLYDMDDPLGPNAHIKAGGDLMMATETGFVPLSAVVQKDPAALSINAVSRPIERAWRQYSQNWLASAPWEAIKWPSENMLFITLPSSDKEALVANLNTGRWAKYTGWDTQCATLHNGILYFGSADGFIYQAERGGSDDGDIYTARWSISPNDLGAPAAHKSVTAARASFTLTGGQVTPQISFSSDYQISFPAAPEASPEYVSGAALWDAGVWDTAMWDDGDITTRTVATTGWVSQGATGYMLSPQVQVTSQSTTAPTAEYVSMDIVFNIGDVIV